MLRGLTCKDEFTSSFSKAEKFRAEHVELWRDLLSRNRKLPGWGKKLTCFAENKSAQKEKSAAVFAVRRANYTHRRKGVFNAEIIVDSRVGGNVRFRTNSPLAETKKQGSFAPLHE